MARLTGRRGRLAASALLASLAVFAAPHALANDIVALKNALYGAGYEIDNVRPQMDDGTRQALTAFQRDQGLEPTGSLNDATKEALGMVSIDVAATSTSAPASASASNVAAETGAPAEQAGDVEDDVEEDDDGGWSFF